MRTPENKRWCCRPEGTYGAGQKVIEIGVAGIPREDYEDIAVGPINILRRLHQLQGYCRHNRHTATVMTAENRIASHALLAYKPL